MQKIMNWDKFAAQERESRDIIDVKRIYIDIAGDLVGGVFLSQVLYWNLPDVYGKTKLRVCENGELWLAKNREDWWQECRITPKQYDRVAKKLEGLKIISTTLKGFSGKPTIHIKLNKTAFLYHLERIRAKQEQEGVKSILPKGQKAFSPKVKKHIDQKVKSNTETTTKNTTETTTNSTSCKKRKSKKLSGDVVEKYFLPAYNLYPGMKGEYYQTYRCFLKGCNTSKFDPATEIKKLVPAIEAQIKYRRLATGFVAEWKKFEGWLSTCYWRSEQPKQNPDPDDEIWAEINASINYTHEDVLADMERCGLVWSDVRGRWDYPENQHTPLG